MIDRSTDNLLSKAGVLKVTGLPAFALDRLIKQGRFLPSFKVSPLSPRWRESAVRAWMIEQYDPALSLEPPPPRAPKGRRRFIQEGLLCSQAPEHDGVIRSPTKLSRHIVHVDDLALTATGVYFLWRGQTIVYVGQSRTGFNRIAQHVASQKRFDGVSFVRCPAADLDRVEREYIDALLPEYNADGITLGLKRRRTTARRALSLSGTI